MANARDVARQQLGELNLNYLNDERNNATNVYNTNKQSLDSNFNNLLEQLNKNRATFKNNFEQGKNTLTDNLYDKNRLNNLEISSRVMGKSGLSNLGELNNRLEVGKQYSNLTNKYYNDLDNINTTEKIGRDRYNLDNQGLYNSYRQNLANIGARENEARNQYNMQLANLAQQIQSRWDSNANAQRQLALQRQALANQEKARYQQYEQTKLQDIVKMMGRVGTIDKNGNLYNIHNLVSDLNSTYGMDREQAINYVEKHGLPYRMLSELTPFKAIGGFDKN